jgi:hypothetical protein
MAFVTAVPEMVVTAASDLVLIELVGDESQCGSS